MPPCAPNPPRTHLAVLHKKYLDAIIERKKSVEARLSQNRIAPFARIHRGDTVYLKQSAGPVRARTTVKRTKSFSDLTPAAIRNLRNEYNHLILAAPDFWKHKRTARYATLIWLTKPILLANTDPLPPIPKLCGQAWLTYENT